MNTESSEAGTHVFGTFDWNAEPAFPKWSRLCSYCSAASRQHILLDDITDRPFHLFSWDSKSWRRRWKEWFVTKSRCYS